MTAPSAFVPPSRFAQGLRSRTEAGARARFVPHRSSCSLRSALPFHEGTVHPTNFRPPETPVHIFADTSKVLLANQAYVEDVALTKSSPNDRVKESASWASDKVETGIAETRTGVAEVTTSEKVEVIIPTESDDNDLNTEKNENQPSSGMSDPLSSSPSGQSVTDQALPLGKLNVAAEPLRQTRWPLIEMIREALNNASETVDKTTQRLQQAFDEMSSDESSGISIPTREQALVFLSELTLVLGLLLLLRAGVSQTLRWIHGRLDPNRLTLPYEQSVFECMQRPLEFLSVFTVGTSVAEAVSRPLAATGLLRYIRAIRELGVIFAATWFLLRWIERIRSRFVADVRIDKAQVDAISRIATVVTAAISVLISFDTLGINIQTVLAFGGIGGVAIGFAGREIISNFFSGFMIYVTRPFTVGEWIRSIENKELDGTVEEIGWYMTRVRTWDKRPLYIPNSRFSTLVVETPSRMTNRRIKHSLRIRLEDMSVVRLICKDLERSLLLNQDLDPRQHRMVYVEGFFEHSVGLWLSCFTKTVFMSEFRKVQQDVLLDAFDIIRSRGGRIASDLVRDLREGTNPDRYAPSHPLIEERPEQEKEELHKETVGMGSSTMKSNGPVAETTGTMRIHSADKSVEEASTEVIAEVVVEDVSAQMSSAASKQSPEPTAKRESELDESTKRPSRKPDEGSNPPPESAATNEIVSDKGTMRIARASDPPSRTKGSKSEKALPKDKINKVDKVLRTDRSAKSEKASRPPPAVGDSAEKTRQSPEHQE